MEMSQYYLAVDIGASSGRHMLACIQDEKNQTRGNLSFRKWNEKV